MSLFESKSAKIKRIAATIVESKIDVPEACGLSISGVKPAVEFLQEILRKDASNMRNAGLNSAPRDTVLKAVLGLPFTEAETYDPSNKVRKTWMSAHRNSNQLIADIVPLLNRIKDTGVVQENDATSFRTLLAAIDAVEIPHETEAMERLTRQVDELTALFSPLKSGKFR